MKKFEGWRSEELRYVATLMCERDTLDPISDLYDELIREIRNRRIAEELFQMKLEGIDDE